MLNTFGVCFSMVRACGLALALCFLGGPVHAQDRQNIPRNPFAIESMVDIEYQPPKTPDRFTSVYDGMSSAAFWNRVAQRQC